MQDICSRDIRSCIDSGPWDPQMNESPILGTKLSVQVARCVTWRIARCYDPDALFKVCPPA